MSRDIQDAIDCCSVCAKFYLNNTQQPHKVPDCPWAKLCSDIFTYNGTDTYFTLKNAGLFQPNFG